MSAEQEKVVIPPSEVSHDDEKKAIPPSEESQYEGEGDVESSTVNERALIRKLDIRLLPAVTILYLLSFLDRANVGNAYLEGLGDEINMSAEQYYDGLSIFFVGYVIFEVPWNIILKRTTPKFWLPTITVAWGIVATLQGVITNKAGFYAVRFFLGFVEGGLFPGVVFYLSMWYVRRERQFRIAMFFSAAALAGAFGGILAYGISFMNGIAGLGGWAWIFILEGILTAVVGALAYWFICNYPDTCPWLKPAERAWIQKRLAADSDVTEHEGFTWGNVMDALKDPKVWLYCWGYHFLSLCLYTIALFLPSIIENLGYSAASAQLLTIPPYALAAILTVIVAWTSEWVGRRAPFLLGCNVIAMIGYIILISNSDPLSKPYISYIGTFFTAAGTYPAVGLILSWPAVNVGGQTKRAVANALQITIGNCGAVIGTQIYRVNDSPRYIPGHAIAMAYVFVSACVTGITWWYLAKQNKKKRAVTGEDAGVVGGAGGLKGDADPRWIFML